MSEKPNGNSSWMRRLLNFLEDDGGNLEMTEDDGEIIEREEKKKTKKTAGSRRKGKKMPKSRRGVLGRRKIKVSSRDKSVRKRKSRKSEGIFATLFRVLVGVLFIGVVVFGISFLINPRESAQDTLKRYVQYLNERDYEKMYDMLDNTTKQNVSKETFVNRNKRIYKGIDAADIKVDIKKVKRVSSSERQVQYEMSMKTLAGNISFEHIVTMLKGQERDYDVVWDDSMIFPELTSENKVHVTTDPANRGRILDRNDVELAKETTVYNVILDKAKLDESDWEFTVYTIASIIGKDSSEIREKLDKKEDDAKVKIAKLSEDKVTARERLSEISCITLEEATERIYPYGKYTAHVVGYIQKITADEREKHKGEGYSSDSVIGKRGAERLFESKLRARDGHTIEILYANGTVKSEVGKSEKQDGQDVKLTIDISTQVNAFLQFQNDKSCTVAINPSTGEVLALASTPTYNPNKFITGFTEEEWNAIDEAAENPLYSRYQSVYCPGSSFKPITAAIGLDTGAFTADENFGYTGTSWQKDSSWGKRTITTLHEYGSEVVLKNALIYSDNIYFARAALKIGGDKFLKKVREIGFYKPLDFDFSLESSVVTEDENGNLNADQQLADTGYGQAQVLVNPVHMASVYSAFLNEGNMIRPYLEYREDKTPTYAIEHAFTEETAQTIKEDLIQVVENVNGTAHSARIYGKTIGGKTGTAELKMTQDDETGTELGWFNAFSIHEEGEESKDILVVSMVEDVKGRGGSGYVVPRVRNILANYGINVAQRYANIYTGEDDEEKEEWGSRGSTIYSHTTTTAATTATTATTQSSTASTQTSTQSSTQSSYSSTSTTASTTSTASNTATSTAASTDGTTASTQTSTSYGTSSSTAVGTYSGENNPLGTVGSQETYSTYNNGE